MQPLTADPRSSYTVAQIQNLIAASSLTVDYGVELLDASLNLVSDISSDVTTGSVKRDNTAVVHGTVDLTLSRQLAWGKDRIRPYMLLSSPDAGVSKCRFNQGVFLLTTPTTPLRESPITYSVTGMDQLTLLQDNIGDTYAVSLGTNVITAVKTALTAAGITAPVLIDTTANASVLASVLYLLPRYLV